jgi:hypothetical protein
MAAGMVADMAVQPTAVGTEAVQCIEAAAAAAAPCTGGAEAAPEAARAAAAAAGAAAVYGLDLCVFNRLGRVSARPVDPRPRDTRCDNRAPGFRTVTEAQA